MYYRGQLFMLGALVCAALAEGNSEEDGVPGRQYKRGLAPYSFVPWEAVHTSPLNLPIHKMDFYVPG